MSMDVGGKGVKNEINVVPLIDIVLVLLVIFMVVTPLMQKGIDINIPEKSTSQKKPDKEDKKKTLVVSIRPDSSIDVNSEGVARAELEGKLREMLSTRDDKTVFIKAAGSLIYGSIIEVMDICKAAGVKTIAIITEKK
ncbi:MAG: biopolymer transporter ExbD [Candidatus Schekmanbacteria bacterium]|nr:biopolymer transporter ExbD [Candidatus Schekmanbacteria bacterium]